MLWEPILKYPVESFETRGAGCDCLEITCPVCGQSPIVVPVSVFTNETVQECPSCDMIFRHSFRHETAKRQ